MYSYRYRYRDTVPCARSNLLNLRVYLKSSTTLILVGSNSE